MSRSGECFQVPPDVARIRLDRYLSEIYPEQSRSQLQGWIRSGCVLVNNVQVKTGYQLRSGDQILLRLPASEAEPGPLPEPIPLSVVFQDEHLAVVEKPAGLVCHAGAGVHAGTLVNALLYHLGALPTGDVMRPGIVHRLDKLTSGLMVVAKNASAHRALAQQFKSRSVRKEYLALVYGSPCPPAGTIDIPLGRDLRDRKKISVRSRRRRAAVTHYRVESRYGPFSLLVVRIETGRTHQIRVHLSHIGHPVVGDLLYGGNRFRNLADAGLRSKVRDLKRHFLHAHRLEFFHPLAGDKMNFISPLPSELRLFLEDLS